MLLASTALAGTWVREPGHAWLQLAGSSTTARSLMTETGERVSLIDPHVVPGNFEQVFDEAKFRQLELRLYGELGIAPELELYGALPLRQVQSTYAFARGDGELNLSQRGVGDAEVGTRWGRPVGPVVVAVLAGVRLPLYDNAPAALGIEPGNADIYDDRPPLGQGTVDVDLSGAVGAGAADGWVQAEAGVRIRNRRYGMQLPARFQAGVRPAKPIAFFGELGVVAALTDGEAFDYFLDEYTKGPAVLDRQSWVQPGGGVVLGPFGPGLGGILRVDAIVSGRRTAATTTWSASVTLER